MRVTSPGGAADYEGRVMWSPELGYGVRPPEAGQTDEEDESEAERNALPGHGQREESVVEAEHGSHGGLGGHAGEDEHH